MTEGNVTIGMAILELIELYHDDHIEYYKVVVTICALFGCDPARLLNEKQRLRLEEVRATVPARSTSPRPSRERVRVRVGGAVS